MDTEEDAAKEEDIDTGFECPWEDSDDEGDEAAGGCGAPEAFEDGRGGFVKTKREWMRAERRLCASFSLARFTRLVISRMASVARLRVSPERPVESGSMRASLSSSDAL